MNRSIATAAFLTAALTTPAFAATDNGQTPAAATHDRAATHTAKTAPHTRKAPAAKSSAHAVIYNKDSKDPHVGWHTVGGMRECTQDCDNPEIPGSGYTCHDTTFLGMAMRECTSSSW